MKKSLVIILLLTGCAKQNWLDENKEKCRVQGGQGIFLKSEDIFECWGWAEAPSLRFKLNKDTEFKPNKRVKLFDAKYGSK